MQPNASLKQDEGLRLEIKQSMVPQSHAKIELYFCIPNEMGINPATLSENAFFHNNIKTHLAYNASGIHLPLVRSRFVSKTQGNEQDYRLNLNLYCYQVRLALDTDVSEALIIKESDAFYVRSLAILQETKQILRRLRRYKPTNEKLLPFYQNADNFLSWHCEQALLALLDKGERSSRFKADRAVITSFCEQELAYRDEQEYNSAMTLDDPNRLANKMLLLQRLIEYGVVLRRETHSLNMILKRFVKGSITTIIMAFVMLIVLTARSNFTQITVGLVLVLGTIYGLREIFKEDITRIIWRRIIRGRAKWLQSFFNTTTRRRIAKQKVWLEYISPQRIPKNVAAIFSKRRQQNKQAAQWLYLGVDTQILVNAFLPGYDALNHRINISLAPMMRYLRQGEGKLYELAGTKVRKHKVERRYQISLVMVAQNSEGNKTAERYNITLNRRQVIEVEKVSSTVLD